MLKDLLPGPVVLPSNIPLVSREADESRPFLSKYNYDEHDDGFKDSRDSRDVDDYDDDDKKKRFSSNYDDASRYLSPWRLYNTGILGYHHQHHHHHYRHHHHHHYRISIIYVRWICNVLLGYCH